MLLISLLAGVLLEARAQTHLPDSLRAVRYRNAFLFEILGNAAFYSFNYQRTLHHWKGVSLLGRVGASYLPLQGNPVIVPVEALLVLGVKRSKAEVGIGVMNTFTSPARTDLGAPIDGGYELVPTVRLGYRRDRDDRNFFTLNVLVSGTRRPFPWLGIGLGKYFRNKREASRKL